MTELSIVIPAYNEEHGIESIARRVLATREGLAKVGVDDLELLIVDDGSRDRTAEVAAAIDGVTLIRHPRNRGYGAALKTGFSRARGELIGFLDADGTYPPEFFPELCRLAMNGSDLVIGSRMAGAASEMPLTRRMGNLFFAALLSAVGAKHITDSASGMRVFKRSILEKLYPLPDGLNLTPVMSTRAVHENLRMAEDSDPVQRARRAFEAQRLPGRVGLPALDSVDGAQLQPGAHPGVDRCGRDAAGGGCRYGPGGGAAERLDGPWTVGGCPRSSGHSSRRWAGSASLRSDRRSTTWFRCSTKRPCDRDCSGARCSPHPSTITSGGSESSSCWPAWWRRSSAWGWEHPDGKSLGCGSTCSAVR